MRMPEVTIGGRWSNGTAFLLTVMPARSRRSSASCPVSGVGREVDEHEVVVGAAGDQVDAARREHLRPAPAALCDDVAHVLAELLGERLAERDGLRGDDVHERAALQVREHRLVDGLPDLLAHRDHDAGARPAQRLVGGGGHDVGDADGLRVHAGGDQAGEVRHVDHQLGADLVGDLAERREVEVRG